MTTPNVWPSSLQALISSGSPPQTANNSDSDDETSNFEDCKEEFHNHPDSFEELEQWYPPTLTSLHQNASAQQGCAEALRFHLRAVEELSKAIRELTHAP